MYQRQARETARLEATLLAGLADFHGREPLRPGLPRAALRGLLPDNVPREAADLAMERLEAAGQIVSEKDLVRERAHRARLGDEDEAAARQLVAEAERCGLEPPSPKDWAAQFGLAPDHLRDLLAHLERQGELVRAPGDLWFSRAAVEGLREKVNAHFEHAEELDTQTYKALIGTSRRTAMPLMELLDEMHVTRRSGEVRIARGGRSQD